MMVEFHDSTEEKAWLAALARGAEKSFDNWYFRK
jgi:hypothetical protein